jgi:hypothetical protein
MAGIAFCQEKSREDVDRQDKIFHHYCEGLMKKIHLVVILGLVLMPLTSWAQTWSEPYSERNGTQVEGHWDTPQDAWQKPLEKPGKVNPMTGQFNRYGNRNYNVPASPETNAPSSYYVPGSSPERNAPSPKAIPGSSSPNPYAIPGSSPNLPGKSGR